MTINELTEAYFEEAMAPLTQEEYDSFDYMPLYSKQGTALSDDGRGDKHGNFY